MSDSKNFSKIKSFKTAAAHNEKADLKNLKNATFSNTNLNSLKSPETASAQNKRLNSNKNSKENLKENFNSKPDKSPISSLLDINLNENLGKEMHALAKRLFPINRSITGAGFRTSLDIINKELEKSGVSLNIYSIKSGSKAFDWVVPPEWNAKDAYIITPKGRKICDFKQNNLHLWGYSSAIDAKMSLEELLPHLYALESEPSAVPYVTSYYKKTWGFSLSYNELKSLKKGIYKVFIDSKHDEKGVLNYADLLIKGKSKKEVLISTYLCHPSMANNELSGSIVALYLAKALLLGAQTGGGGALRYSYRFVFVPETIGSIVYLSKHLKALQKQVIAGFVLSCIGDERASSLIHSPSATTLADKIALHTLKFKSDFKEFSFLDRGSDERQYCAPLINLPVVTICNTRFGDFKEYHTSLDDLSLVTPKGLFKGLSNIFEIIKNLELNDTFISTTFCEPNLGKRGLYHSLNNSESNETIPLIANFLAFCDGQRDLIDIANILNEPAFKFKEIVTNLLKFKLIKRIKRSQNDKSYR